MVLSMMLPYLTGPIRTCFSCGSRKVFGLFFLFNFVFVFVLFFCDFGVAGQPAKKKIQTALLDEVDKKYKEASSVSMDHRKRVKYSLLAKTKEYKGRLWIQGQKLRLDTNLPDKSLVIIDKEKAWLVNYLSDDAPTNIQVTKIIHKKNRSKDNGWALLSVLGSQGIYQGFSPTQQGVQEGVIFYMLKPNHPSSDLKEVKIKIDPKRKVITDLSYWDELDNQTDFEFTGIVFGKPLAKETFEYIPPKGVKVELFE